MQHNPIIIIMLLSKHRPRIDKIDSVKVTQNFAAFLAGIIDGDGHINKIPQLCIVFHEKDVSVAYYLKSQIGFGTVSKVKNKGAYTLIISHKKGLQIISTWVRHRLRLESKRTQYNTRLHLLPHFQVTHVPQVKLFDCAWFCGFFYCDGFFQIKLINRADRRLPEVRLVIQIDQKDVRILELIKHTFGGSIGYRASQNTYYWSSVSFRCAQRICTYFDKYPLMGAKQLEYILWRRVYTKIQEGWHLKAEGIVWIEKQKQKISLIKAQPIA